MRVVFFKLFLDVLDVLYIYLTKMNAIKIQLTWTFALQISYDHDLLKIDKKKYISRPIIFGNIYMQEHPLIVYDFSL